MTRLVVAALFAGLGCGSDRSGAGPTAVDPAEAAAAPVVKGVVAHRGASHEAPENTLAAFARAWELGAESCETDVRVTADGHVVIMHDETTRRTGGVDRAVRDQTLAELKRLDVGAWKGERYRGERVPTLQEALAAMPAGRMMFVELKDGADSAAAVAAAIREADPRPRGGSVALQAYDPLTLAAVAKLLPDMVAYWTVDAPQAPAGGAPLPYPIALVAAARAGGFGGLALDYRGMSDPLLAAIAEAGLELDVWTINDAAALRTWLGRARWVETDRPELAHATAGP